MSVLSRDQREAFIAAARPLMQWMAENLHPHHQAVVTSTDAELLEGVCASGPIFDYLKEGEL